ncbi:hypothetical protein [Phocaeicola dorei]|uniref:hypothetical protein n=1 Tax=Phocaeicola dorei TaxID=357276 RepID=UPI00129CA360|nr:hypothetical protein [Phocaeicola dorei]
MPEEAYSLQKRQNNLYQESRPKESKNKKIAMTAVPPACVTSAFGQERSSQSLYHI